MKAAELTTPEIVPTGIAPLDELLGGGITTRVIVEIAGSPSVGKSTLALQFIGHAQKLKRPCLYADAERAQNFVQFATAAGVDCNELEYIKTDYAEALLDETIEWAENHKSGVIVVDAIGALHGRAEAESDMESKDFAIQSRMIAKFCRKLTPIIDRQNHILIMVNHVYTDPISGRHKSSGGAKLEYSKGVAIWLKEAYGHAAKRSTDGTKKLKTIEIELKKSKTEGMEGRKTLIELIPKIGFVCDTVEAPVNKRGRPAKVGV